jgi:hypothetical protein
MWYSVVQENEQPTHLLGHTHTHTHTHTEERKTNGKTKTERERKEKRWEEMEKEAGIQKGKRTKQRK